MITIKLLGGLGNQMFQYAFGRSMSISSGLPLALDVSGLRRGEGITPRVFGLDKFAIHCKIFTESSVLSTAKLLLEDTTVSFRDMKTQMVDDVYCQGYWQNENYFKVHADVIRGDFELKLPLSVKAASLRAQMQQTNSIVIQVRRGDYVTNPKVHSIFPVCNTQYFQSALKYIITDHPNPHLFIISDDIAWCKKNMVYDYETTFVSTLNLPDYEELTLIKNAKHVIISNSSFGWWGAWLNENPNKIIIAPKKWLKIETPSSIDIVPTTWKKI